MAVVVVEVFVVVVLMQKAVSLSQRLAARRPDTKDSPSRDFSPKNPPPLSIPGGLVRLLGETHH
ncbi:MAG TPA: hypothetical protein VGE76_05125 [Opitutaceae bacterium]